MVVEKLFIQNLRGSFRDNQLMVLIGSLKMVLQFQLLLLRGVPITKWLSLRMLVEIALVVNFKGSAYRVRAAHWVHDHS